MSDSPIRFDDGAAYERMMGVWSRLVGEVFLDWLSLIVHLPPAGRHRRHVSHMTSSSGSLTADRITGNGAWAMRERRRTGARRRTKKGPPLARRPQAQGRR